MAVTRAHLETDDGARIAVHSEGAAASEAAATVVLAHGWTLTHRSWDKVAATLVDEHPDVAVLRADQRDHGSSTAPRLPATIDRLADDLAAVVDATAPDGDLVLGGHSMGGMTVMALAARRPDLLHRTRGVLLVSTSTGGLSRPLPVTWGMRLLARLPSGLPVPRVPSPAARLIGYGPGTDRGVVTRGRHGIRPTGARAVGSWFGALMSHDGQDALDALSQVPVTVIVGAYDRLTPVSHSARIAAGLPHAELVVVPDAGHMLPLERPHVVVRHLARWVG